MKKMQYEGGNVGSLCKIELIDVNDIETFPEQKGGQLLGDVELKEGKEWDDIYFIQDTAQFVEVPVAVEGSEVYRMITKWNVPKDTVDNLTYLINARKERYVARLTPLTGNVLIAGTKDEGCAFVHTMRDLGTEGPDRNQYLVELNLTRAVPVTHAFV